MGAPPNFIAVNLAHPKGLLGRFACFLMNRHNRRMNAFARGLLGGGPGDRVLEIGFGGGPNLADVIPRVGRFTGIDRSADAVRWAASRFATTVHSGRARFIVGDVDDLPVTDREFTKVLTINTIYFWTSLDVAFTEIRRVLQPGGRVYIGFLPSSAMAPLGYPAHLWTLRSIQDVRDALSRANFEGLETAHPRSDDAWVVVSARRPEIP